MAQLLKVVMIINCQFIILLIFCECVWVSFDHLSSLSINYILRIPQRRALLPGLSVFLISPRMVAIVTDEKRAVLIIWLVFSLCLRDSEKRFSMFHHSVLFFCLCHTVSSLERLRWRGLAAHRGCRGHQSLAGAEPGTAGHEVASNSSLRWSLSRSLRPKKLRILIILQSCSGGMF